MLGFACKLLPQIFISTKMNTIIIQGNDIIMCYSGQTLIIMWCYLATMRKVFIVVPGLPSELVILW